MKKKILSLILIGCMCIGTLVGCNGSAVGSEDRDSQGAIEDEITSTSEREEAQNPSSEVDEFTEQSKTTESESITEKDPENSNDTESQMGSGTDTPNTDVPAPPISDEPVITEPQPDTPAYCGALQVVGNQLCDSKGDKVFLHGLSTHGIAWFPDYINEAAFKEFREVWGANVIRLAMYTAEYNGYCTGGDKEWLKGLIRKGVEYATKNDLYVIVDWHVLNDNNPQVYKSEAINFFKEMSAEFANHNNVIYEICNEPCNGTGWKDIKSYAEEVIPVIRANDNDAIIIVGTPNWSQYVGQAAADPIKGYDNIMYALHFYADTHTDWLRNDMVNAINSGLPIFVTEYGICDASGNGAINEYQANEWIRVMNENGISYCGWNISNKNETSAIFKTSCNKTSGWTEEDLSDSGKWMYNMLRNT